MNLSASTRLFALLALLSSLALPPAAHAADARPNILWLIAEDFGVELNCYGDSVAHSPRIDALAESGVRYSRFYTTAPVCSASRSAFMTGMYQTTIGAHNHRSHRDDGYQLPDGVKLLTEWFRDAGYYTANIQKLPRAVGFAGAGKNDWNFARPDKPFDSRVWADLKSHQPFFAQINFKETHRKFQGPKRTDPAAVRVPPYEPNHPVTRADRAAYYDAVAELDRKVGRILDQLEADGLADDTVVVFFADNGQAHIRGKQFCYEEGLHVPLVIRWPRNFPPPAHFTPGTVDDRLLMAIDLAPTMLTIAGAPVPPAMQGAPLLGDAVPPPRDYIFGARDRCDGTVFRFRTARDDRFRYIRNFTPDRPFLQANAYKEKAYPAWNLLKELKAEGKLAPAQEFLAAPTMPEEELYDLAADPDEIHNLADVPAHQADLERLRTVLEKWIVDTNDQGRTLEPADLAKREGVVKPETPPNRGYE